MKSALVTGANGFLGRKIVSALREAGWHTTGIVRRNPEAGDLVVSSLREENFAAALASIKPNVVVHAVGAAGPLSSRQLLESNVLPAADLFTALDVLGLDTAVVVIGSAAEYGYVPNSDLPVLEDRACMPSTIYGISKFAQSLLALSHARRPVLCARLFNPIGPGMPPHLALGDFTTRISRGEAELCVGNLDVKRDFICVEEAARLIAALCDIPKAFGQTINICVGEAFSLRDIVNRLVGMAPQPVRIITEASRVRANEMPELYGSTARLGRYGLTPKSPDFTCILKRMITDALKARDFPPSESIEQNRLI